MTSWCRWCCQCCWCCHEQPPRVPDIGHTDGVHDGAVNDPELAGDVVGVASARLLAAGVPAHRRLTALRLLGVLGSVADADLEVRRPVGDLAREFGLDPREAGVALDDLTSVDVVRRHLDRIVLGGIEPPATGGLRLQDFLALADDREDPRRRHSMAVVVLRPAAAALAAAALIAAVFLAPGALRERGTPVSSHGGTRTTTTTSVPTASRGAVERPGAPVAHRQASSPAGATAPTTPLGPVGPCAPGSPGLTVPGTTPGLDQTPSTLPVRVPTATVVPSAVSDPQGQNGPSTCAAP
jgi:hypothetical protein